MIPNRCSRHRIAWLLAVALFVATLAPWAATARAAMAGLPGLHDLCLSEGSSTPTAPDAPVGPSGPAAGGHCPLCVLQSGPVAPPPALEAVLRVPAAAAERATPDTLPLARESAPRAAAFPPRAPPRLG